MDGSGSHGWSEEQTKRICAYRFQQPDMPTDGLLTGKYAQSSAPAIPAGIESFTDRNGSVSESFTNSISGVELLGLGLGLAAIVLFFA
jgi:hypothetical protein